jgi:SNF2 family DNA or RNA helicase
MTFANPGMLGSAAEFEERFEQPITHQPGGEVARELRAIVRPFILRRRKADVLAELPPKTLIDRDCILGARQKRLYDALALALQKAVKQDIEKRGLARSRLSVLTAILRLRQMACDPRLVDPTCAPETSAKRAAFLDVVRALASEGRRALVFSQFVELFTLWREDLERERIAYEYLDGASVNREAIVDRFQRGDAPLFLISLKAGGAGLNLTAADTVIHCDPWWNPAVLDQATDRAHRIGQKQSVTVLRLVAKGTIEDRIALLEKKKRALADAILSTAKSDEAVGALAALTEDDIALLLGAESMKMPRERATPRERPPTALTAAEIDDVRAMVRWLERTGFSRRDLAKRVSIRASVLALLLIGHRVKIGPEAAARVRALYEARRSVAAAQ